MFILHCPRGELSFVVQMDYRGKRAVVDLLSSVLMVGVKWLCRCDVFIS